MRVLYTDLHLHSLNPTNTLMSAMVGAAAEVTRFGPGFVPSAVVSQGLARFMDNTGPYDAIFLGPNVPLVVEPEGWPASLALLRRYAALAPEPARGMAYLRDLFEALPRLPVKARIACMVTLDCYAVDRSQTERLENLDLHLLAPDEAFAPRQENLPDWAARERHFRRKRHRLSNAWVDFISRKPDRILSGLHFVAESEFMFRNLEDRPNLTAVPGVAYVQRQHARRELRAQGFKPRRQMLFVLFRVLSRLGLPVFGRFTPLKMFNLTYQANLVDTRFVYAGQGGFLTPTRKFLEIPASGATMICTPHLGFAEMGFRNGENYVEASPEEAPEAIRALMADPDRAQSVADAGRDLVWRKHSLSARAAQLRRCLELIGNNRYAGSRWHDGEFVIDTRLSV